MNISLHCTKCGKTYQTKSENAGKRAKCLKCGSGVLLCLGALIHACSAPDSEPRQEAGPRTPAESSQPDGGNHGQNSLGPHSSEGGADLTAPDPSSWVEFTDAGGRFRCRIPSTCRPEQKESGVRSYVRFRIGEAEIGVIVRITDGPPIDQPGVEEIARGIRDKTAAVGARTSIESKRFAMVDGHPAADIVSTVRATGLTKEMRSVKIVAHGFDHAITLTAPSGSFQQSTVLLGDFLKSYQVGPFDGESHPVLDRQLPPELDYDIDE